ncbi:hypothetical protein [Undibacterium sp. TS12]|uniref:tetratricopeptide repeat protein n=1 Tax=Undibacterium sp. TS12 TaxID=2908202 RepID=UPI001F4D180B|nr:hypothetical protein [Undibacterium sp. TS12]MCH8621764.1 hypothetical protein [Undibacterium sp. TS12]
MSKNESKIVETLTTNSAVVAQNFHVHGNMNAGDQPTLSLTPNQPNANWEADSISRFHFSARATKLFGRDDELRQLKEFCNTDSKFLWWGIIGKGGTGKSRLALELAHALDVPQKNWNWMFLGHGSTLTSNLACLASDWTPEQPTLLVVDYVAGVADQLKEALNTCAKKATKWKYPVRLLFLERTTEGGWHERLLSALSNEDKNRITETKHSNNYLALEQFSLDEAYQLVEALLLRYSKNQQQISGQPIKDLLNKLDIEHRPLFALFLADAIAAGKVDGDINWDTDALLMQVLTRELERWKELGVTDDDRKLLRFTTLAGTLDLNASDLNISPTDYIGALLEAVGCAKLDSQFNQRWATILHGESAETCIPRLEPDLLGELFVLSEWTAPSNLLQWNTGDWKPELQACWKMNGGRGLIEFLMRAIQDFPKHPKLKSLIQSVELTRPNQAESNFLIGILYANLAFVWMEKSELVFANECYKKLVTIAAMEPKSGEIALLQAMTAVNMSHYYGTAGDTTQARAMYEAIVAIEPKSQEIALQQAMAAVNLCIDYGNAGDTTQARAMYEAIVAIEPKSQEIDLRQAKAAFNLCTIYGNAGDTIQARAMYEAIVAIEPKSQEIALQQAMAAVNLCTIYGNAGDTTQARAMYEAIVAIEPKSQEIALQQAMAAFNLYIDYGKAGDTTQARAMYEAIVAIEPKSEEITSIQTELAQLLGFIK